ncbi:MAG: septum formation initiator family protein [Limnochordia bacterium]|jgi:cell division protein FtsL|nr:septum formation initiator family protein [Limnochordia bacterium]
MTAARKLEEYSYNREETLVPQGRPVKRKRRIPATLKICLVAACFVALGLLYLQQQVTSYYLSMELAQLQQEVNTKQQRNDHIMLSLESQRSLKQVEQIARTQLGMVDPAHSATLVLSTPSATPSGVESRWTQVPQSGEGMRFVETLLSWMNRVLPIGGVEAGTLHR